MKENNAQNNTHGAFIVLRLHSQEAVHFLHCPHLDFQVSQVPHNPIQVIGYLRKVTKKLTHLKWSSNFCNHCISGDRTTWTISVQSMIQSISATGSQKPERMSWDTVGKEGVCSTSRVLKGHCLENCPLTVVCTSALISCIFTFILESPNALWATEDRDLKEPWECSDQSIWGVPKTWFTVVRNESMLSCNMLGLGPNLRLFAKCYFVINLKHLL